MAETLLKASSYPNRGLEHLTVFDKAAWNIHWPVLYVFKSPMPSNQVLKSALSQVLVHFPHLAGRLTTDRRSILLNNAGIRVIERCVPTTLAQELPFDASTDVSHLLPAVEGVEELFQIQFSRYVCGSLVMGLTYHHYVADAQSMSYFAVAWARLVRGLAIHPLPCHERDSVLAPRTNLRIDFDHKLIEFKKTESALIFSSSFEYLTTHFSVEFINNLKAKVNQSNQKKYSTFECLLAHVWKTVTHSRGLALHEFTQIKLSVNGRSRMKPVVPMAYFGNLVLWAYPRLRVRNLLMESYAYVAQAIHEAVAVIDDNYLKSFIDFGELCKRNNEELRGTMPETTTLCPNLEVESWLTFKLHNLDFGGGRPFTIYSPNAPAEGLLIFASSCREEGGIDAHISLFPQHAHHFKQICHSLYHHQSLSSKI
ncbi:shikimate O-hydroxycinnamoyltransferase [Ranunculus cassubicifolius]